MKIPRLCMKCGRVCPCPNHGYDFAEWGKTVGDHYMLMEEIERDRERYWTPRIVFCECPDNWEGTYAVLASGERIEWHVFPCPLAEPAGDQYPTPAPDMPPDVPNAVDIDALKAEAYDSVWEKAHAYGVILDQVLTIDPDGSYSYKVVNKTHV